METLRLKLFGRFELTGADGAEIPVASRKGRALLAYLALSPEQRATRTVLATLLWGSRFDEQARASLRQCLSDLRKSIGDAGDNAIVGDGDWLSLEAGALSVDILESEAIGAERTEASLRAAAALNEGVFYSDFDLDEEGAAQWHRETGERLRAAASENLRALAEILEQAKQTEEALEVTQRLVALDPLDEAGHRLLMILFDRTGRRNDALRQYQHCLDAVREGLDVEPEAQTTALFERIRDGESAGGGTASAGRTQASAPAIGRGKKAYFGAAGAAVVAIALAALFFLAPRTDLPLPDKPSIAVLPFLNISSDPELSDFPDGITIDIIAKLSRVPDLFVIDRHSAFAYKGQDKTARQISRELGVRYLVQGSVQAAGGQVRINIHLVNALEGEQLWADQYERELSDLFELQNEMALQIAGAIASMTELDMTKFFKHSDTSNLKAYGLVQRGRNHLFELSSADNREARRLFMQALALDPNYARAQAFLAWTYLNDARLGWSGTPKKDLQRAAAAANRAIALNDFIPAGHEVLGDVYLWSGRHDLAFQKLRKALQLNPSGASIHSKLSDIYTWAGRADEGLTYLDQAERLNPHYPYTYFWYRAHAHFVAGRMQQAIELLRQLADRKPDFLPAHLYLAVGYHWSDRPDEARNALMKAATLNPNLKTRLVPAAFPYKEQARQQRFLQALAELSAPSG